MHGGLGRVVPGKPLPTELTSENLEYLERGAANMVAHIRIARQYGIPVVVCINRFTTDTDREIALLQKIAKEAGAYDAVPSEHWEHGGAGAKALAESVIRACEQPLISASCTRWTSRSRTRSRRSPPRSMGPTAWITPRRRGQGKVVHQAGV